LISLTEKLQIISVGFSAEPIFEHVSPNPWYVDFALKHDIKLRLHPFYNPDFFLENGAWLEATLSENSAYKKIFRYGHQAEELLVLWSTQIRDFTGVSALRSPFPMRR
jgi:hypothetical protein